MLELGSHAGQITGRVPWPMGCGPRSCAVGYYVHIWIQPNFYTIHARSAAAGNRKITVNSLVLVAAESDPLYYFFHTSVNVVFR